MDVAEVVDVDVAVDVAEAADVAEVVDVVVAEFSSVSAFGVVSVVWAALRAGSWVLGQAWVDERENVSAADSWTVVLSCPFPKPAAFGSLDRATP